MKNLIIASTSTVFGLGYLEYLIPTLESHFKNAETIRFANGAMAVTAMLNNQLDVEIIDEMPARVLTKTNSGVELVDIALTDEEYAIAVSKGNEELLNKINEILRTIKQDGRMQDIINKYYVQQK